MPDLTIILPFAPYPWQRSRGSGRRRFTPTKYRKWKDSARVVMRYAARRWSREGPFRVDCEFVFPMRGKPLKRSKRPRARKHTLPDGDNLEKAVFDSGNGILWRDDGQICAWSGSKWFAAQGEESHVRVQIWRLDAPSEG